MNENVNFEFSPQITLNHTTRFEPNQPPLDAREPLHQKARAEYARA
jgi:hypothetical protein